MSDQAGEVWEVLAAFKADTQAEMDRRFDEVAKQLGLHDVRLEVHSGRLDGHDHRFASIDQGIQDLRAGQHTMQCDLDRVTSTGTKNSLLLGRIEQLLLSALAKWTGSPEPLPLADQIPFPRPTITP